MRFAWRGQVEPRLDAIQMGDHQGGSIFGASLGDAGTQLTVLSGWRKPSEGTYSPPDKKPTEGLNPDLSAFFKPKI